MANKRAFLPTANIPRAHPALARLWRENGRRSFDAIFLTWSKWPYADALGWQEFGRFREIPPGWTTAETLREIERPCDVVILHAGDRAYYANCLRASEPLGSPSWCGWQTGPTPATPLEPGPLLSELTPTGEPDWRPHGTLSEFWEAVDRLGCFTWVLRLDAAGDLLLTLSHLRSFKRQYPQRRIGLVVQKRFLPWLQEIDWIDGACGVDILHWNTLLAQLPKEEGPRAWINPMPGMLRVAGNRVLSLRVGPTASAHPDRTTACTYSPGRHIVSQRELLSELFDRVSPSLPMPARGSGCDNRVWFSPFPGDDERLWPPDRWAEALKPLAGVPLIMQSGHQPVHQRWEAEFKGHALKNGIRVESARDTATLFDLCAAMEGVRGWVGINSSHMHVAGLLGLPSLALGSPWEVNAMWEHPTLQIVAAEALATALMREPTRASVQHFGRLTARDDAWADGLYYPADRFAEALAKSELTEACRVA